MAVANPGDIQYAKEPHCPICLGKFKTPRQLPCLHSVCQGCLEDCISSAKVKELKQFKCPVCRTVVPIRNEGKPSKMWASQFPIDSILQSMQGKEKLERPCDCCLSEGVSVTAHGFCVVCEEAMCETCLNVHQKLKLSKDHSIITKEELTNNPTNVIRFDKSFRCQEHKEEDLKLYCRDHTTACCVTCGVVNHRQCSDVLELMKDANNLLQEVEPLRILDQMNKLEDYLVNFEKRNESNIISLELQVQEMTNKIQEIRKKLNGLLDDLESKVKLECNQLYEQEAIRKKEENQACQAILNAVRNSHVTLETVMKHGNDTQKFLMADRMISQVKLYYKQITEKFDEMETASLNLEVDPQIQCVVAQGTDIGRVICRMEHTSFPIPRAEKPLEEWQIEKEKIVEIKGPDEKSPTYAGATYLHGDQVMLADNSNKRVFLLDSSYQYISSFTIPDTPWGICVGDHQEVAVSIPNQKIIQFLSVTSGTIKPTKKVQTRYNCWGIASAGNGKLVVSGPCDDKEKYYWSLISSTGEEKCHQIDCQCDPSSTDAALNSSCTRVYITVWKAHSLYCFDMDGTMTYKYSHDNLKDPVGVATDRDDNVYVVGRLSHNIHQLNSDGTPIRILTDDIPNRPQAICLNNSNDKFLISNGSSEERNKIYMFRIK